MSAIITIKIALIRYLAKLYPQYLKAKRARVLAKREEVEEYLNPLELKIAGRIELPLYSKKEEILAAYRFKTGKASVSEAVRLALFKKKENKKRIRNSEEHIDWDRVIFSFDRLSELPS